MRNVILMQKKFVDGSTERWEDYAINEARTVEQIAAVLEQMQDEGDFRLVTSNGCIVSVSVRRRVETTYNATIDA